MIRKIIVTVLILAAGVTAVVGGATRHTVLLLDEDVMPSMGPMVRTIVWHQGKLSCYLYQLARTERPWFRKKSWQAAGFALSITTSPAVYDTVGFPSPIPADYFRRFEDSTVVLQRCFVVHVPLWAVVTVFATYPAVAFIRGPVRRWRRPRKGLCIGCGYDLTGNVSGVCPECGKDLHKGSKC